MFKKIILVGFVCLKLWMIKFGKTSRFWYFLVFLSNFGLKIRVLDKVYDYLILYFAVVIPAHSLCKKLCLFAGSYYALRLEKKLQILTLLKIFSIFELKIRVFDEVYAYLILQFAVVFLAQSLCKNIHIDSISLSKIITLWN